ncbi:MAG: helix-turn-helix domain-containing protein [Pseudomonadales bacterium]
MPKKEPQQAGSLLAGTTALTNALKQMLKQAGITYVEAAKALELSEASVKRLFSEESFTLKRVETLCQLAGAELADLVRQSEENSARQEQLTPEQEQALAEDMDCLVVAICTLNRYRFEDILLEYDFTEAELQQQFTRLDRLGVIDLLPGNRYRLRVARGFRWRQGGPIERLMIKSILSSFLERSLLRQTDQFRFSWGTLTPESVASFRTRLNQLADEFNLAADQDARRPLDQRSGSGLLLGLRTDWVPSDLRARKRAE